MRASDLGCYTKVEFDYAVRIALSRKIVVKYDSIDLSIKTALELREKRYNSPIRHLLNIFRPH
ncbi:MAG TPA: hypothetical protein DD473_05080 [Planctomycetaceae bacterium]|nr:hypothetical protein [Planctomycetaceae bacterium]